MSQHFGLRDIMCTGQREHEAAVSVALHGGKRARLAWLHHHAPKVDRAAQRLDGRLEIVLLACSAVTKTQAAQRANPWTRRRT